MAKDKTMDDQFNLEEATLKDVIAELRKRPINFVFCVWSDAPNDTGGGLYWAEHMDKKDVRQTLKDGLQSL